MKTNRIILTLFYALLGSVLGGLFFTGGWLAVTIGAIVGQGLTMFNFGAGILAINLPTTLKEAREQRAKLETDLKTWDEDVKKKKKDDPKYEMTRDELDKWSKMVDDAMELKQHVLTLENHERILKDAANVQIEIPVKKIDEVTDEDINRVFWKSVRFGNGALDANEREIVSKISTGLPSELRAQSTTTTAGGYLIPTGFQANLEKAMLAYDAVEQACTIIETPTGNDLHWPMVDDTSNEGQQLAENTQETEVAVTFGEKVFKAWKFSSRIVLVSVELVQDSAFNLEQLITGLFAERLGRVLNTKFTTGAGTTTPEGIVTGATTGVTAAVASLTRANLVDLMYSVNASYRAVGAWMISDTAEKLIRKLSFGSADDRPLWQMAIKDGLPDTIEGKPYYTNLKMSAPGATQCSVLFGDLKKYMVRKVKGMTMMVFREKYMDYGQIGFMAYCRYDGQLLDAGTHPIKKLVHSTT